MATSIDSRIETRKHIDQVRSQLASVLTNLAQRSEVHDASKLESPEREVFDEFTSKLATSTYGSDEYRSFLAGMKPALEHHYAHNSHHPEHWPEPDDSWFNRVKAARDEIEFNHSGEWSTDAVMVMDENLASRKSRVRSMSLLDLIEMLCDWKAATLRHNDGDLAKSIEINQKRFGYSDEMKSILMNTAHELKMLKGNQ